MSHAHSRKLLTLSFVLAFSFPAAAQSPLAENRKAFLDNISRITIEAPKRQDGTIATIIEEDLAIRPNDADIGVQQIRHALEAYAVVSSEEYSHPLAQIWRGGSAWTGQLILREGKPIRWVMPFDGMLCLRFSDGRWLYLLNPTFRRHPEQENAWEPTAARSTLLFYPTDTDRCEAAAVTRQEAQACISAVTQGLLLDTKKLIDASAGGANPLQRVPISLALEPAKKVFTADEPLLLYLTIFNHLAGPVWFGAWSVVPNDWNGETLNCGLVDVYRNGNPQSVNLNTLEPAKAAMPGYLEGPSRQTIDANGSLTLTIDARKWRIKDGWMAGDYRVTAQASNIEVDEHTSVKLISGPAAFTILKPPKPEPETAEPKEATLDDFINEDLPASR